MENNIKKIIFAVGNGITRAPMMEMIMKAELDARGITEENGRPEVVSRGTIVSFPEPINQKAEAVMISHGLDPNGYISEEIDESDIAEGAIVFTVSEKERQRILRNLKNCNEENTFIISEYVGDELPVMDPIGGTLAVYGLCFESLQVTIRKLVDKLYPNGNETVA